MKDPSRKKKNKKSNGTKNSQASAQSITNETEDLIPPEFLPIADLPLKVKEHIEKTIKGGSPAEKEED